MRSTRWSAIADLGQMAKPRIALMVAITAFIGFGFGIGHTSWSWPLMVVTLGGTALACMGASVLNQILESDTDALMQRTRNRPLPTARIGRIHALALGLMMPAVGIGLMALCANWLAAILLAITVIAYTLVYTPMKRFSSASTFVGAAPGAAPPVIGYAAATGTIGVEAAVLFAILFLWQLPHFLAISWLHRDDYEIAGIPVLSVLDRSGVRTFRQIVLACIALMPIGFLPTILAMSGMVYLVVSLLAGLGFLAFALRLMVGRTRRHARALFYVSLLYLPVVFSAMLWDRRW